MYKRVDIYILVSFIYYINEDFALKDISFKHDIFFGKLEIWKIIRLIYYRSTDNAKIKNI